MVKWQVPTAPAGWVHSLCLRQLSQSSQDKHRFESIQYLLFTQLGVIYDADEVEPIKFTDPKTFPTLMVDLFIELNLLNIKKLLELMRLDATELGVGPLVPKEILDLILPQVTQSSLITRSQNTIPANQFVSEIPKLARQIDCLFREVDKLNPYIWKKLAGCDLNGAVIKALTREENTGYLQQAEMSARRYASYWSETPQAVKFLKEKIEAM
ncbi:hypothetical protein N7488_001450 [Penicillium malachiteum]|nr:hypothetical protein N7488_001450 [Penicillium malachiteum]